MDMGTQNILVDAQYNLVAVIDWEFAQTAPWQTFDYPMPFPLRESDPAIESTLAQPESMGHKNAVRQAATRKLYRDGFKRAEDMIEQSGSPLRVSLADALDSPAVRVYTLFSILGRQPEDDERCVRTMLDVAYGWPKARVDEYLKSLVTESQ